MATMIQVRVDDDIKNKADVLFKELGTDTTTAIRIFLSQAIAYNGFPFEIKKQNNPFVALSREQIIQKLDDAKKAAEEGDFQPAEVMVSELINKYGL